MACSNHILISVIIGVNHLSILEHRLSLQIKTKIRSILHQNFNIPRFVVLSNDLIAKMKQGFGQRVETFFRHGCGITLGVQPLALARKTIGINSKPQ